MAGQSEDGDSTDTLLNSRHSPGSDKAALAQDVGPPSSSAPASAPLQNRQVALPACPSPSLKPAVNPSATSTTPSQSSQSQQPGQTVTLKQTVPHAPVSPSRPYQQQFSAATQMILNRIKGENGGSLSSALSSAAASTPRGAIQPSTYADVKRRLLDGMSTTTMQMPSAVTPSPLGSPALATVTTPTPTPPNPGEGSTAALGHVRASSVAAHSVLAAPNNSKAVSGMSAIQKVNAGYAPGRHRPKSTVALVTPKVSSAPSTSAATLASAEENLPPPKRGPGRPPGSGKNVGRPAGSGRPPGRPPGSGKAKVGGSGGGGPGIKRKRSLRDDGRHDGSISSDGGISDSESTRAAPTVLPTAASTPHTTTKSGRQIQKPETYNPAAMDLVSSVNSRRYYQQHQSPHAKAEQALCRLCSRGAFTKTNQMVFCDGCNDAWHQRCHGPAIEDSFISEAKKQWHCTACSSKMEKREGSKKASRPPVTDQQAAAGGTGSSVVVIHGGDDGHTHNATAKALDGRVSWLKRTVGQKRAYLASLSHTELVDLVLFCTKLHPDMPIFPTHENTGAAIDVLPSDLRVTTTSRQSQPMPSAAVNTTSVTAASPTQQPIVKTTTPQRAIVSGTTTNTSTTVTSTTANPLALLATAVTSYAAPSDAGTWEDTTGIYAAWKRPRTDGAPATAMAARLRDIEHGRHDDPHLEDPGDFEAFSHTVHNKGRCSQAVA